MALSYIHLLLVFCVFGITPGSGKPQLMDGGLELRPGQSVDINATQGWSGCFWGRRSCSFDNSGKGSCVTGDCGGVLKCAGAGGAPPATFVYLVDGYNMPVSIFPSGGSGECKAATCVSDLNQRCPKDLQCCCSGAYSTPETCKPTEHSNVFKASCPTSYSYAYDDPTNTFTCKGANYLIRFC
ncbi:hypothetical protein AAG906_020816 [Vitis piasezkii]